MIDDRLARGAAVWFWEGEPEAQGSKKRRGRVVGTWRWTRDGVRTREAQWARDPKVVLGSAGYLIHPTDSEAVLRYFFFGDVELNKLGEIKR